MSPKILIAGAAKLFLSPTMTMKGNKIQFVAILSSRATKYIFITHLFHLGQQNIFLSPILSSGAMKHILVAHAFI